MSPQDAPDDGATASAPTRNDSVKSITLHVVSPHVPDRITFQEVSVSTTIHNVKERIQEAVASKPAPDRQRLIYQGRPLLQGALTLNALFGEAIAESDTFTIHLVLPNAADSHSVSSSADPLRTLRPDPQHPRFRPSTPEINPNLPPRPSSTSQLPNHQHHGPHAHAHARGAAQAFHHHHHHHEPHPHLPHPQHQAIPQAQEALQNHFAVLNNMGMNPAGPFHFPVQAGLGPLPFPMANIAPPPPPPRAGHNQGAMPINPFPQANGQQDQAPPSGEQPRPDGNESQSAANPHAHSQPNQTHQPFNLPPAGQAPATTSSTTVREGQIPGGHWRMVVNQTTGPLPNFQAQGPPGIPHGANASHSGPNLPPVVDMPGNMPFQFANPPNSNPTGRPTVHQHFVPGLQPQNTSGNANVTINLNTTAYLLSSPAGPQALLVSPSGLYASPGYPLAGHPIGAPFAMPTNAFTAPANHATPAAASAGTTNQPEQPNRQPLGADARPAAAAGGLHQLRDLAAQAIARPPAGGAAAPAAPMPAAEDPGADLVRMLFNLGGHLWLFIRIAGFVYLFGGAGAPWPRTLLIVACTTLVFLAQNRAFRPVVDALWAPVRRHVEELVQDVVPAEPPQPAAGAANPNGAPPTPHGPPTPAPGSARPPGTPGPRDSPARATMRRAERAIALFVASLVPGVGERHVAARDEAARRARQEENNRNREGQGGGARAPANEEAQRRERAQQEEPMVAHVI